MITGNVKKINRFDQYRRLDLKKENKGKAGFESRTEIDGNR
jgi:hypothetical protein